MISFQTFKSIANYFDNQFSVCPIFQQKGLCLRSRKVSDSCFPNVITFWFLYSLFKCSPVQCMLYLEYFQHFTMALYFPKPRQPIPVPARASLHICFLVQTFSIQWKRQQYKKIKTSNCDSNTKIKCCSLWRQGHSLFFLFRVRGLYRFLGKSFHLFVGILQE